MSGTKIYATRPQAYRQELLRVSDVDLDDLEEIQKVSKNVINEYIQILRDWYNKQPHFPPAGFDDHALIRFLAINKFSIEKTKFKIENLLTAKSMVPDFFSIRDPTHPKMSNIFEHIEWMLFPEPTPDKYRVTYIRLKPNSYDLIHKFDPNMMYTMSMMLCDIRYAIDAVRGDIHIWDCSNLTFAHATKIPPALIRKCAVVMQKCYAQSFKGIHMVNVPLFAEFTFKVTKSALPKKLADRIFMHKNLEAVYDYIPRAIFPKDMGGDEPKTSSELAETWRTALESPEWRQWFLDTDILKTDESKRPSKGTINDINEEFGVDGSFKKLDID